MWMRIVIYCLFALGVPMIISFLPVFVNYIIIATIKPPTNAPTFTTNDATRSKSTSSGDQISLSTNAGTKSPSTVETWTSNGQTQGMMSTVDRTTIVEQTTELTTIVETATSNGQIQSDISTLPTSVLTADPPNSATTTNYPNCAEGYTRQDGVCYKIIKNPNDFDSQRLDCLDDVDPTNNKTALVQIDKATGLKTFLELPENAQVLNDCGNKFYSGAYRDSGDPAPWKISLFEDINTDPEQGIIDWSKGYPLPEDIITLILYPDIKYTFGADKAIQQCAICFSRFGM